MAINLIQVVAGSAVEESVHYVSAVPIIEPWDDDRGSLPGVRERSPGTEDTEQKKNGRFDMKLSKQILSLHA